MRTLYYYTSYQRWPAVRERGEVPVDEVTTDADRALNDNTGAPLAVA